MHWALDHQRCSHSRSCSVFCPFFSPLVGVNIYWSHRSPPCQDPVFILLISQPSRLVSRGYIFLFLPLYPVLRIRNFFFSDPDPTWRVISDPDRDSTWRVFTNSDLDPTLPIVSDPDPSFWHDIEPFLWCQKFCLYHWIFIPWGLILDDNFGSGSGSS